MGNRFVTQGLSGEATYGTRDDDIRQTEAGRRPNEFELAGEQVETKSSTSTESHSNQFDFGGQITRMCAHLCETVLKFRNNFTFKIIDKIMFERTRSLSNASFSSNMLIDRLGSSQSAQAKMIGLSSFV